MLKADMDDILSKPYSLEDCTRLLRRWLTRTNEKPGMPAPTHAAIPATHAVPSAGLSTVDANAVSGLRRLRGGKQADLYPKLVDLFRASLTDSLAKLREALDGNDLPAAAAVCHKLASSAANVGALAYARQARQIEQLCAAGEGARAKDLHEPLQAAHVSLLEALQDFCLRESA
ncbi:MAG: Hpt domain-containing protein [Steroidobacteraceae bacterium]